MLYMVIERFRNGDPVPIYRRLRDRGRMMPEGVTYVSSWISEDLVVCFQVMGTDNVELLRHWAANRTRRRAATTAPPSATRAGCGRTG